VGDGTIVPVDDIEEAEEPSSHASSDWLIDSGIGASGGNLASFDLANDFWRSLISSGHHSCVDQKGGCMNKGRYMCFVPYTGNSLSKRNWFVVEIFGVHSHQVLCRQGVNHC
jgi:hypothetical protein